MECVLLAGDILMWLLVQHQGLGLLFGQDAGFGESATAQMLTKCVRSFALAILRQKKAEKENKNKKQPLY